MADKKIVEAVGAAVAGSGNRSKEMQDAMDAMITQAYAAGVIDPAKVLEGKEKLRAQMKAQWKKEDDAAAAIAKAAAEAPYAGKVPKDATLVAAGNLAGHLISAKIK